MLRRGQRITAVFDESKAINITLKAGQASLHNAAVLHGSAPNNSAQWRLAVGLNFVSGNVAPINGYQDSTWLIRGQQKTTGFAEETPATISLSPESLAEYDRAIQRIASRYNEL